MKTDTLPTGSIEWIGAAILESNLATSVKMIGHVSFLTQQLSLQKSVWGCSLHMCHMVSAAPFLETSCMFIERTLCVCVCVYPQDEKCRSPDE